MSSGYDLEDLARLSKEELQKALTRALEELGFGKEAVHRGRFGRKPKREDRQQPERGKADQENANSEK
jgi:ferredoxin-NADP reductase